MSERRRHRQCWRPSPAFEWIVIPLIGVVALLLSTCAHAEPTKDEQAAYRVGVVAGSFYSFLGEIVDRLSPTGMTPEQMAAVITRGCSGATVAKVAEVVLLREPVPQTTIEIASQTRRVMLNACASLEPSST
jgi:hypothetical protein